LPGTTAFFLRTSARVSREKEPLYLPLVWHSAQRALRSGTMSWAKSTFFRGSARPGPARTTTTIRPSELRMSFPFPGGRRGANITSRVADRTRFATLRGARRTAMSDTLPRTVARPIQFKNGCAIGISNRWHKGQYCTILTEAGLVGCGIYDVEVAGEFGQA